MLHCSQVTRVTKPKGRDAMATRQDVAARAGVSVATVSYVLNDTKKITPEVRERVLRAVEELNYRPNLLARSLTKKETRHVAMLVDNLNNPHYCEMLSGAQSVASEKGYIVSVISVDVSGSHDVLDLASRGLDGIILALGAGNATIESLLPASMPRISPNHCISFDIQNAFDTLLHTLTGLGHKNIAFLSGLSLASPHHWRYIAWKDALARHGLPLDDALLVDGLPGEITNEAEGMRAARELLARKKAFTALFAVNDLMALGAMRALHLSGLRVPEDVSVVGCDHLQVLQSITPSLATMDMHTFETGKLLMRMLIDEINGARYSRQRVEVDFVPGESIGPAYARPARI